MASSRLIQRHGAKLISSTMIASIALYPSSILNAESPEKQLNKKPIYDDDERIPSSTRSAVWSSSGVDTFQVPRSSTAEDRLALKIGQARLSLYAHVSSLEDKVNKLIGSTLQLEENFTSTIVSLAPAPHTGEKLMPASLYVMVAAMTGSIIANRRNILLRATLPLAAGLTAGWILLPVTSKNISNLLWQYEQRFPIIADSHIRTREAVEKVERMAKSHSHHAVDFVNEKVSAGRNAVQDLVGKWR